MGLKNGSHAVEIFLRSSRKFTCDENGRTALHVVADLTNLKLTQLLIKEGAPINVVDVEKNSPLHLAALKMDKKVVETLINAGSDVKLMNTKGLTPMQGTRLTFAKFMKQLVKERDEKEMVENPDVYHPGNIYDQANQLIQGESDLREMFCLLCKRRPAVAAMVPCGHLCCCEVCQKERVNGLKVCPFCKQEITGAINLMSGT